VQLPLLVSAVPAGQLAQPRWSAVATWPSGQLSQCVWAPSVYWSAPLHGEQALAPPSLNQPSVHALRTPSLQAKPASQLSAQLAALAALHAPGAQLVQADAAAAEYLPAGHAVQEAAPAAL